MLSLASLLGLKRAARRMFLSPDGNRVLRWLAFQTYATKSTWTGDRDAMLIAEGRRQVWLMFRELLDLSDERVRILMEETDSE